MVVVAAAAKHCFVVELNRKREAEKISNSRYTEIYTYQTSNLAKYDDT